MVRVLGPVDVVGAGRQCRRVRPGQGAGARGVAGAAPSHRHPDWSAIGAVGVGPLERFVLQRRLRRAAGARPAGAPTRVRSGWAGRTRSGCRSMPRSCSTPTSCAPTSPELSTCRTTTPSTSCAGPGPRARRALRRALLPVAGRGGAPVHVDAPGHHGGRGARPAAARAAGRRRGCWRPPPSDSRCSPVTRSSSGCGCALTPPGATGPRCATSTPATSSRSWPIRGPGIRRRRSSSLRAGANGTGQAGLTRPGGPGPP